MTLIKIIAALLVILVAAAILFPVRAGGGPLQITMCLSNLKQLATANLIYSTDFDDRFTNRDVWMDAIEPYTKNKELFTCPAFAEGKDPQVYGYCFHGKLSNAKLPANPEQVELLFDSINLARNASGDISSLPTPARHEMRSSAVRMNNIAYADSHVKGRESIP